MQEKWSGQIGPARAVPTPMNATFNSCNCMFPASF